MSKFKVDADTARAEFDRILSYARIDVDDMTADDKEAMASDQKTVIRSIQRGQLTVAQDGKPTVSCDGTDPFTFGKMTAGAMIDADAIGDDQNLQKLSVIIQSLCGRNPGEIRKLEIRDFMVLCAVASLFLLSLS